MNLEIKGVLKTSLLDYPGKIAPVIFVNRCNFRCPFCQNPELVLETDKKPDIDPREVIDYMKSKKGWIDGVSITGGEPTLHRDLPAFCEAVKKAGFLVKVDTNGTNPEMLKELIEKKIVDYIAMDIKAPLDKYDVACGVKADKKKIQESIDLIRKSGVDYEFRSTAVPGLYTKEDALAIGKWLKGSKRYCLQQFRNDTRVLDPSYQDKKPYKPEELRELLEIVRPHFKECEVRGI